MEVISEIQSWEHFWNVFEKVYHSLIEQNQFKIVDELKDAKSWVDDSGDEWFEFYYSLDYLTDKNLEFFKESDKNDFFRLRNFLDNYLHN